MITNWGLSGTNQLWGNFATFASNDVIVLRQYSTDKYQRCLITNWTAAAISIWPSAAFATTNDAVTGATDVVYKMTPLYTLNSLAAGTTNYNAYGSIVGREGVPLLFDIGFSNNAAIKNAVGEWIPSGPGR
jgi:hypothetical protein